MDRDEKMCPFNRLKAPQLQCSCNKQVVLIILILFFAAVIIQLDPTSVRVSEDSGEITIVVKKEGASEIPTAVFVDTRDSTAIGMINNSSYKHIPVFVLMHSSKV